MFLSILFPTVILKPLEVKPVNPKGNQPWIFPGRTVAEAPILWPPDAKNWLIEKDPDVGKDGWQEEKGMTEDEMVGWHHQLNGHEFEQAPGDSEGQGSLACCSPWGCRESEMTEQLKNNSDIANIPRGQIISGWWPVPQNLRVRSILMEFSIKTPLLTWFILDRILNPSKIHFYNGK